MNDSQLQQLLQAINTLQDLGKVAYFNKGTYNSETTYEINDVVAYQGSSYVSLGNNNQGNLPTNTTYWSVVALKGDKGETGKPFVIEKTYISIQEMVADYDNMNVNDYVMISGSIEDEQNATLWTKRETPAPTYKWVYLADFSGASGITGQTPNIQIGNVTEGNEPAVTRRQGSTNENPILDFVLKTGAKGDTGATGNGIASIAKTGTSGLVDTYTVTYTNGNTTTFTVTNGEDSNVLDVQLNGTTIVDNNGVANITGVELQTNKVTSISSNSTDTQYPSAKCVYDSQASQDALIENLQTENEYLNSVIEQAFDEITDEDTEITLNNTIQAKMKMELKGNTQQDSYTGKNLYKWSNVNFSSNETTTSWCFQNGSVGAYGSDVTDKTMYKFELGAGTYKMSANSIDANILSIQAVKNSFPSEDIVTGNTINPTTLTSPITLTEPTIICVRYRVTNPSLGIGNTKIQIEEGSTATSYEPYVGGNPAPNPEFPQDVRVVTGNNTIIVSNSDNTQSQTYPINLGTMELCKIGDYQDYIYNENGNWYKYAAIDKIILDGSESWVTAITRNDYNKVVRQVYLEGAILSKGNSANITKSTHFGIESADNIFANNSSGINCIGINNSGYLRVGLDLTVFPNDNDFKAWLSLNNVTVYYVLESPKIIQITDETLINQLNEIKNAMSYKTQTNISQTNANLPFILYASALGKNQ